MRSNLSDVDPATLWKRYIQLAEAEWAFRIAKDGSSIRPIWRHKSKGVEDNTIGYKKLYTLWMMLAGWIQRSRSGDAPRTIVVDFARIHARDVVLQAPSRDGQPSHTIRLRCVTEPDAAQKVLLSRLGLMIPRRLRRVDQLPGGRAMALDLVEMSLDSARSST